ncbi:MAG: hypothetical protein KH828_01260 [Clostridiales bacterium]|nr:hypothetical protein [Clostridiales bacterium]
MTVRTMMILVVLAAAVTFAGYKIYAGNQPKSGKIFLYGEIHGVKSILEQELQLWENFYHEDGMRDLFIESPYYTAEFLNLWMKAENDDILNKLMEDWSRTSAASENVRNFYRTIKTNCPETVFHGTDVGHQYETTGKRYLEYLRANGQEDSEKYIRAEEAIEQGKYYYGYEDEVYRENMMAENFIRECDGLNGRNLMGIYGSAHTEPEGTDYSTYTVPCMANQLRQHYGEAVILEDLKDLSEKFSIPPREPLRTDTLEINGKTYEASYFGKVDLSENFPEYQYREFWRLEDDGAYANFKKHLTTGQILPYMEYPMEIEKGQVFVIDYTKTDGSVEREYYRHDGLILKDSHDDDCPTTEEFYVDLWIGMR